MTLSDRIRDARKAAGITSQKKLADKVGVSERTVKRWEAGKNLPEEHHRRSLARVLGGTADEWLGVREPVRPRLTLTDLQAQLEEMDETLREISGSVNELLPLVRQALVPPGAGAAPVPMRKRAE